MNNITLIGMPGSGKSFIGRKVAECLGYKLIELDMVMEEQFKLPLQEILNIVGEKAFLELQEKDAIAQTHTQSSLVVSPGGSIIYSARAMAHLKKISKIIYLDTSFATIQKRVADTPRGIVGLGNKSLETLYTERVLLYQQWADVTLEAERDAEAIVRDIKNILTV